MLLAPYEERLPEWAWGCLARIQEDGRSFRGGIPN